MTVQLSPFPTQIPHSSSRHHYGVVIDDGEVSVRGPLPLEEHKLSLVQVELQVVL